MKSNAIQDQTIPYFLTWTTVEWIDIFTRKRYRDIVIDSFEYCIQHKGLILYGYVIMSNHVHLIACAKEGFRLSDIIRDCKKYTSKAIIASMQAEWESRESWLGMIMRFHGFSNSNNTYHQLWQQAGHAIPVKDMRQFYQTLRYIHMNPVKAGIVAEPEHYLYSSARNYAGLQGMIDVTLIDLVPLDGCIGPL